MTALIPTNFCSTIKTKHPSCVLRWGKDCDMYCATGIFLSQSTHPTICRKSSFFFSISCLHQTTLTLTTVDNMYIRYTIYRKNNR